MTQKSAGGIPPLGQLMNGALKQISAGLQWSQVGNPTTFDATFSNAIGGYPKGGKVAIAGDPTHRWISAVDNNLSNPDGGGAGWIRDVNTNDFGASVGPEFSTGYQGLPAFPGNPAGLFMQWFTLSLFSGTTPNENFPFAFPHACIFMLGTLGYLIPDTSASVTLGISATSASQYSVTVGTSLPTPSNNWGVSVLAIGY